MARSEEISLTGLQHQIYLRELLCPGTSLNNNGCVVHYRERVEASDLLAVIDEVILRHASLHVRFVRLGEQPSYRLEPPTPVPVTVRGFGELDTERPALGDVEDLAAFVARFCNAPFDLRAGEALVRFALVRSEREDLLVCSLHHLVSDGVSVGLLLKEIEDCYLERSGLRDVRNPARLTTFQRVLEAEAEYLGSAQEKEDERYWLSALEAPFDVVDLSKRPEASGQRNVAAEQAEFAVPSRVLKRLTRAARIASAAALCGSLALTLAKLEGLRRFVMGLAVHNRGSSQLQTAHGPVSNIVPLVLEVDPSTSFAAWAKQRVTRGLKLGLRHGRYPSFRMLHQLRQRFRLDALFETVFDFQVERLRSGERGHVELVPNDAQLHGLTVKCTQYGRSGDDLGVRFVYLREGFTRQQIEEVFARWMTLLEALARQPEVELGGVSLFTASELEQVRHFSRGPRVDIPEAAGIHDLVVASLQRAPSSTVLREAGDPPSSGQAVSAAEVLAGTARLARALRAAGVGREADSNREPIVGLLTDRGVARAFGVLAILRAGGSYCPLDPAYPEARLKLLIEDTAMPVILTDSQCRTEAVALAGETVAVVCIDEALKASDATDALEVIDGDASRLAYVIYTSGTTGVPKGVMTEHRALVNRLLWMQRQFELTPDDVVLHKTSFAFDVSVWELLWPFLGSASMSLLPPGAERDPEALRRHISSHRVTVLHFVPSALRALLDSPGAAMATVRLVLCSGEALSVDLVARYREAFPNAELFNLYGPTEAAIDVSWFDCGAWSRKAHPTVPIGRPIDNTNLYVVDLDNNPAPPGVVGELVIGGVGVARGYLERPEATRERFSRGPELMTEAGGPGETWGARQERRYRTGDLARWLPDGHLEFLGRNDFQLKIRGHRIEAGEIETRLRQHPGVVDAALLAVGEVGREQLVAIIVASSDAAPVASELRDFLGEILPEAMLPARFLEIETMPLTGNGKRDRAALLAHAKALPTATAHVPAANEREVRWTKIWQETLGRDGIGVTDDFFRDLGGDSLSAVRLVSTLNRTLQGDLQQGDRRQDDMLTVADLTDCPTIRSLGERVREPEVHASRRRAWIELEVEVEKALPEVLVDGLEPAREPPEQVLLTGATGFVGAYLLQQLLVSTSAQVVCLVRAASRQHAQQRVRENLEGYGLYDPAVADRIAAVPGDITAHRLGLADADYEALAHTVDVVFHFAAEIDHHAAYDRLHAANVGSAAGILDFATRHRLKRVAYASTEDIFSYDSGASPEILRDEDFDLSTERHRHAAGYAASKWVADAVYRRAAAAGLPVRLFRFGIITGDGVSGKMPDYQWLTRLLVSCVQMRQRFHTPEHTRLDTRSFITPVDFLARAVVGLTLAPSVDASVFHLSSAEAISWDRVLDQIESQLGVEIVETSVYAWLERCRRLAETGELLPILPFVDQELRMTEAEVDASIAARFRGGIRIGTERTRSLLERDCGLSFPRLEPYFAAYAKRVIEQASV